MTGIILHSAMRAAFGAANDAAHQDAEPPCVMRLVRTEIDGEEGPCAWISRPGAFLANYAHDEDDLNQAFRFALKDLRDAIYIMRCIALNIASTDHDFLGAVINHLAALHGPPRLAF